MKANEINLKKDGFIFNTKTYPARSHYKFLMNIGRVFPTTKAQARHFVSEKISLSLLNREDVDTVEAMLGKHGFKGEYKYTKSEKWVRLVNVKDLHEAVRLEFLN